MSKLTIFYTGKIMQCTYIKPDGSQCWANAMENSEFCWFHAPEVDYDRRESNSRGGKAHRTGIYGSLPAIPLKNIKDVPELLMDTIRQVRNGFLGPRLAATIGYLSGMLLKSFEIAENDMRITRLEQKTGDMLTILNDTIEQIDSKKKSKK